MNLVYNSTEFLELLDKFQKACDNKKYTERIPYNTWRELKKLPGPIKVKYESPFVKISNSIVDMDGVEKDTIYFSAEIYDNGFGRFFYDYVVKERNKMQNTKTNYTAYDSKLDSTSITTLNEDISELASKTTADVNYAYDNISITTPSSSNGYGGYVSDRTTNINIPDYSDRSWSNTGSAVTGSWLELAQKEDIEALTRVLRIAKKDKRPVSELVVDPNLFENPSEAKMHTAVSELIKEDQQTVSENFAALRTLTPIISEYFDENMIMDKNEDIRNNRLAQLSILAHQASLIGNLDNLIVK